MSRINMNSMAKVVANMEKGKKEVSIAQIKEILKVFLIELSFERPSDVLNLVERYE